MKHEQQPKTEPMSCSGAGANQLPVRVFAPRSEAGLASSAVVSVTVEDDEEIDWIWSYLTDGRRVVTGYRITPPRALPDLNEGE